MHARVTILGMVLGLAFAAVHLASELATGGVASHHLLADPELPSVSNWWGLLTLPVLCALAARRFAMAETGPGRRRVLIGFGLGVLWGGGLAAAWAFEADAVAEALFLALFALSLFLPLHRPERIAGFVLAMTFTFGGVLPVLVASVVALASAFCALIRRLLARFIDGSGLAES